MQRLLVLSGATGKMIPCGEGRDQILALAQVRLFARKARDFLHEGMTAPAKFWEDLREKSRVRIEHPDLPENLKAAAGKLTAALWSTAQAATLETLGVYRSEAQASAMEAQSAATSAEAEHDAALQAKEN